MKYGSLFIHILSIAISVFLIASAFVVYTPQLGAAGCGGFFCGTGSDGGGGDDYDCDIDYGDSCQSAPNSCGQVGTGTISCNGVCTAETPSDDTCPVSADISLLPSSINTGESSSLSWSSSYANSCSGTNFSTDGATSGSKSVSPTSDTEYTVMCSNATNSDSDAETLDVNRRPNKPAISGPISGNINTNYTFSFNATDPDGDNVRFRIDWDNDGSTSDNPGGQVTGFVTSGTNSNQPQSWSSPGVYSFKAYTQDTSFLDSSPLWSPTHTITITNPIQCADSIDNDGDGTTDYPADFGCSSGSDTSESPNPQCSDGLDNNGNGKIDYPDDPACVSPTDGNEEVLPDASIALSAPALVRANTAAVLSWSASNIEEDSCTLAGTNGDNFSLSGSSGTQTSSALTGETIFTLSCTDLNSDPVSTAVTVKIAPSFEEI